MTLDDLLLSPAIYKLHRKWRLRGTEPHLVKFELLLNFIDLNDFP
jgi:hypothetical protein